ncbi:MAG: hypothetical protein Q7J72_05595 [Candidatus Omnitrophota bacterium]|nr:hypothetical protein [Candidatus Omnitrophota bacterium]
MKKRGFTPLEIAGGNYRRPPKGGLSLTGFTLIELCLVSLIASVIGLAVYFTFSNGMRIWQKANQKVVEEDLSIFFDRFASDVRSCLKFSGLGFLGTQERLEIVSRVVSRGGFEPAPTIGRVAYFYESKSKALFREEKDLSRIFEGKQGIVKGILENLNSLKFGYYFYDKEKKEYVWLEDATLDGLPLAVRIEFELNTKSSSGKFVRTVSIPIGG